MSRRAFLSGVLLTGTLTAGAIYLTPGGRPQSSITLRMMTGQDPSGARALLIDMWNRANPRTEVEVLEVPGTTQDQKNGMLSAAEKGQVDILNLDVINIPLFVDRNHLEPVELNPADFLSNTLFPSRLGACDAGARYWAVPYASDVGMLFARGGPEVAAEPGAGAPPMAQVIDGLVQPGSQAFAGQLIASSSATQEAFVVNVLEHALSRNPQVLDERGAPNPELTVWQDALAPLREAVRSGKMNRCAGESETRDRFRRTPLPFMRNWPAEYRALQSEIDPGVRSSTVRVSSLPIGILGGQSLAITRSCRDKDRARAFVDFLVSESSQKILTSYGQVAAVPTAYADANLQAFIPHLENIRGAVEGARPRPIHPNYSAFADVIAQEVQGYLAGTSALTTQFLDRLLASLPAIPRGC